MSENLELREWIAVNVMGLRTVARDKDFRGVDRIRAIEGDGRTATPWSTRTVPPYELTWNAAALVVEAMKKRFYWLSLIYKAGYLDGDLAGEMAWVAEFRGGSIPSQPWTGRASQHSAPLAICLAAKAAIEATQ